MERFEVNSDLGERLQAVLAQGNQEKLKEFLEELHVADIAEILDDLSIEEAEIILSQLDGEDSSNVLMEMDEDQRRKLVERLSPKEIAEKIVENLESDDAADLLGELDDDIKEEVISEIEDVDQASDIIDLLNYDEGTAGALMGKEMVVVQESWDITRSVREMRKQAGEIEQIYTIYVVDDKDVLKGRLPLKKLLTANVHSKMEDILIEDIQGVRTETSQEEVAQIMDKYDLVALPVVDALNRLVGRITIDDVVDVIREEADKDYQMASGIVEDIEYSDSIWQLMRARLPWLIIGVGGSMMSAIVIGGYEKAIATIPALAFFIPMITATGGNVGVQSSAIIVQGLANNTLKTDDLLGKLWKELQQGLLNGLIISVLALVFSLIIFSDFNLGVTISLALFLVILFASITGTLIPLSLEKLNVDPALATGPFITTMNDITGLFIYFLVGQYIYTLIL
ncbi:magnesium transporter [bacterium SCSIO 12643]|nr:magnesium transporter [bacterium SCSIO 12643]